MPAWEVYRVSPPGNRWSGVVTRKVATRGIHQAVTHTDNSFALPSRVCFGQPGRAPPGADVSLRDPHSYTSTTLYLLDLHSCLSRWPQRHKGCATRCVDPLIIHTGTGTAGRKTDTAGPEQYAAPVACLPGISLSISTFASGLGWLSPRQNALYRRLKIWTEKFGFRTDPVKKSSENGP